MECLLMSGSHSNLKKHALSASNASSFIDPAIIETYSFHGDEYEEDENTMTTTIPSSIASSVIYMQRKPSPPQPTASTSLDHLWSKKEKYDNLELRLLALEESEKRFEYRLQILEEQEKKIHRISLKPMKPDQQTSTASFMQHDSIIVAHDNENDYKSLYLSLLNDYSTLQLELKGKDERIQDLLSQMPIQGQEKEQEEKPSYREEDGYLLFDTTTMNGEITHCRVKIPPPNAGYYLASPPATRVGSPQYSSPLTHHHQNRSPKKGLNPNAPEWRKENR